MLAHKIEFELILGGFFLHDLDLDLDLPRPLDILLLDGLLELSLFQKVID